MAAVSSSAGQLRPAAWWGFKGCPHPDPTGEFYVERCPAPSTHANICSMTSDDRYGLRRVDQLLSEDELVADVLAGVKFKDGIKVTDDNTKTHNERVAA
jgi:hypothetical protein